MKSNQLIFFIVLIIFLIACNNRRNKIINRDTSITNKTSFNNLFLDSIRVEDFLNNHPEFKKFEQQYFDFYKQRNFEYAWFDTSGLAEQSHNFINLLNNTISDFEDSSLYNADLFQLYKNFKTDSLHHQKQTAVLQTELLFTGQFFAYAAKVYKGSDIDASELGWFIPRKKVDLTALLDSSLKTKAIAPDQYAPLNNQYKQLENYLVKYFELDKQTAGVWDSIPAPTKLLLKKGDSSIIIAQVKNRLQLLGDINLADSSQKFDSTLFTAVKKFQRRMGLSIDGVIGAKMIEELNVPVKQRIKQLLVNMERVRWMPAEKNTNYVMVNIPEFKMHVYDSGKLVFDMNVIVGKTTNSTVIFTGNLKYIVFSPYWNVPPSIVKKEVLPGIRKNKNYLEKNNMEITGQSGGLPVVRQKPGANNSLGGVKFLFPNTYDIYLHDTPNRELFNASTRSFSHGCIRIGEPKKFAQYLLRADTATIWKSSAIDSSMHLQKERWITLQKTTPVFIVYFTAWVDKNGILNFRKDIYGHDEKMSEKLFVNK
ncbi:MAG TPA: L,D-transpeptidase family protein [Chitinophagaceae bacterium]|nr:L,D-transpeptidase family protein [Chitinophagaceae bacterium]